MIKEKYSSADKINSIGTISFKNSIFEGHHVFLSHKAEKANKVNNDDKANNVNNDASDYNINNCNQLDGNNNSANNGYDDYEDKLTNNNQSYDNQSYRDENDANLFDESNRTAENFADVDERNLYVGFSELQKVPYVKVTGDVGLKKNLVAEDSMKIGTNLGLSASVELKNGKFSFFPIFCGAKVKMNAKLSPKNMLDNSFEGVYNADFKSGFFIDKDGAKYHNKYENDFGVDVNNQDVVKINDINESESVLIAHNRNFDFGDFANFNVKLGYNQLAANRAFSFITDNQESIKRGVEKVVEKCAASVHEKTGKALKEFIDMPYIID